jgi:hypothetical protein
MESRFGTCWVRASGVDSSCFVKTMAVALARYQVGSLWGMSRALGTGSSTGDCKHSNGAAWLYRTASAETHDMATHAHTHNTTAPREIPCHTGDTLPTPQPAKRTGAPESPPQSPWRGHQGQGLQSQPQPHYWALAELGSRQGWRDRGTRVRPASWHPEPAQGCGALPQGCHIWHHWVSRRGCHWRRRWRHCQPRVPKGGEGPGRWTAQGVLWPPQGWGRAVRLRRTAGHAGPRQQRPRHHGPRPPHLLHPPLPRHHCPRLQHPTRRAHCREGAAASPGPPHHCHGSQRT